VVYGLSTVDYFEVLYALLKLLTTPDERVIIHSVNLRGTREIQISALVQVLTGGKARELHTDEYLPVPIDRLRGSTLSGIEADLV